MMAYDNVFLKSIVPAFGAANPRHENETGGEGSRRDSIERKAGFNVGDERFFACWTSNKIIAVN